MAAQSARLACRSAAGIGWPRRAGQLAAVAKPSRWGCRSPRGCGSHGDPGLQGWRAPASAARTCAGSGTQGSGCRVLVSLVFADDLPGVPDCGCV